MQEFHLTPEGNLTLETGSVRSFKDSGIDVDTNAAVSRSIRHFFRPQKDTIVPPSLSLAFLAVIDDVNQGPLSEVPFGGKVGGEENQGICTSMPSFCILITLHIVL